MTEPHRDEIAKLEALHGAHPEGRVFTHLAEAYRKAGEHGRALETIEAGLVRHAEYASAHVVRGRVLLDLGQAEGAAAAFRNVLELDRHNLIALRALGDLARDAGRPEEALGYFRELLTIDPADTALTAEIDRLERAVTAEPVAAERGGLAEQAPTEHIEAGPADSVGVVEDGRAEVEEQEGERDEPVEAQEAILGTPLEDERAPTEEPAPAQGDEWDGFLTLETIHLSESDRAEPEVEDRPWPDSWWSGVSGPAEAAEGEAELAEAGEPELAGAGEPELAGAGEPELAGAGEAELAGAGEAEGEAVEDASADFHWTFPGWGEEEEAVEVRTETMAALYASQGLWGRAAEIYRGLLAERPGDMGLEERLRDAEARIEQSQESGRAAEGGEAGAEQWLEGVESAWTGGQGAATPSASPYDWEEDAEDATPGPSAGEYLRSLAEWRPGGELAAEPSPEDELPEADGGEAALREWLAEEPTEPAAAGEADWPPLTAMEPSGEEPAGEDDEDVEMFRTWLQSLRK